MTYLENISTNGLLKLLKKPFSKNCCFLCKRRLTKNNTAKEHVIPNWILDFCELKKHIGITMLNQQKIQYTKYKIPCCFECNNKILNKKIEIPISKELKKGYDHVKEKYEKDSKFRMLFAVWTNLIYFKLYFSEISRRRTVSKKHSKPIIKSDFLKKQNRMLYLFILRFLIPKKIHMYYPNEESVFQKEFVTPHFSNIILKCQTNSKEESFDLVDNKEGFLLIKLFDLGIVSCFNDFHYIESGNSVAFENIKSIVKDNQLHLCQLREVFTWLLCERTLFMEASAQTLSFVRADKNTLCFYMGFPFVSQLGGEMTAAIVAEYQKIIHTELPFLKDGPPGRMLSILADQNGCFLDFKNFLDKLNSESI